MIVDTLRRWEHNRGQYGGAVQRALAYISALNIVEMPPTLELEGQRMIVMKQTPDTEPFEERLAEVHARHADIHLVVEGEEWQGFAAFSEARPPVEDRLEEKDYALFRHVENEGRILLRPGDFSVYWPGEIHRPNCRLQDRTPLTKLVVKIHCDLF